MQTGRIVIVTGAAGGIGHLVAQRFIANGDSVIAADIDAEGLERLAADAAPDRLHTLVADISQEADCAAVADKARAVGSRIDVLVNVAGWFPLQPFEEMTAQDFRRVVDVNLTGAFLMIKACAPLLRGRQWGRIVTVGSASTFDGVADQAHYVAAKSGLFGLSRSLARVFGKDGITVNVVTPGLTSTPAVTSAMPREMIERQLGLRAVPREEQAGDLVGAIFFLASPDADFISGQTINVDGGKFML